MIKNWCRPYFSFYDVSIYDLGEETDAVLVPAQIMQRSYFILHFVISGEGTYILRNGTKETHLPLSAGDVFAVYPYEFITYKSNPDNPMHYCWVDFNGNEGEGILEYLGFSTNNLVLHHDNPTKIYDAFLRLFNTHEKNDKYQLLLDFLFLTKTIREGSANAPNLTHQPRKDLFVRAENYIKKHITENIKASDVANFLHLDRSYFSTIFKQEYKMSPYAYIKQHKLDCAKNLLRTTDYSVQKIANMLNFSDVYAFSAFFKKNYGVSPSQFKKDLL